MPEHELSANLNYKFWEKFAANLAVTVKGQEDIPLFNTTTFTSERYKNDGYTKVDVGLNYTLSSHFDVWTRVENVFDADYNVGGYRAPGIGFYGGIKATL
jgi:outer membrane receptor for ferrienterochelin and colicin